MSSEGPTQPEASPARRAAIPLLHRVHRLVLRQAFLRPETLSAGLAVEWCFAGVHAEVKSETPRVDERASTHAADVVLPRGVQRKVAVQRLGRREGMSALVAVVVLHPGRSVSVSECGSVRAHV